MTNILNNDLSAFLKAQELLGKGEGVMHVTASQPLRVFIDPKRLQSRLDRIAEYKLDPVYREYMEALGGFTPEFIDFLGTPYPDAKVLSRGDDVRVEVKGSLASIELWKHPISTQLHSLHYAGNVEEYGLDYQALTVEAIRRFQTKTDLIRNAELGFVEGGSRYVPSWEWYSLLLPTLIGDIPDLLLGTTNVFMALAHGLRPISLEQGLSSGLTDIIEFDRIPLATVDLVEAAKGTVVVSDTTAFQMAHLHSHFGDRTVFEWGADLTADVGPIGGRLPLTFQTREES